MQNLHKSVCLDSLSEPAELELRQKTESDGPWPPTRLGLTNLSQIAHGGYITGSSAFCSFAFLLCHLSFSQFCSFSSCLTHSHLFVILPQVSLSISPVPLAFQSPLVPHLSSIHFSLHIWFSPCLLVLILSLVFVAFLFCFIIK